MRLTYTLSQLLCCEVGAGDEELALHHVFCLELTYGGAVSGRVRDDLTIQPARSSGGRQE